MEKSQSKKYLPGGIEEKYIAAFEALLDMALKNTIIMISSLNRTPGFTGKVVNQDNEPVGSAAITLTSSDGKIANTVKSYSPGMWRWAYDKGEYDVSLPRLGKYRLTVKHSDYYDYADDELLDLSSAGHRYRTIALISKSISMPQTGVWGCIVDANNRPVANVDMIMEPKRLPGEPIRCQSKSDGYYSLSAPAGHYWMTIRHSRFKPQGKEITVTANKPKRLDFKLIRK